MRKALRETFGLVQAQEQQAAEHFHDSGSIERRERQKLSFSREHAIGNQGMGVRIGVHPIGAERLQGEDTAGADFGALKQRLEDLWTAKLAPMCGRLSFLLAIASLTVE